MKLQLKSIKMAGGEETLRFTAEIYIDKTRIANVSNGGTGGSHQYNYYSVDRSRTFKDYIDQLRNEPFDESVLFHRRLAEYLQDFQERIPSFNQKDIDSDLVVDCQIQLQEDIKACKKETVFTLANDKKGIQHVINRPFSSEIESFIVTKYGSNVVILNKLIANN